MQGQEAEADVLDRAPFEPFGRPFTYGPDGRPITLREACDLVEDLERRTLRKTPVVRAGRPYLVRTVCLVFDPEAATGPVPDDHEPSIFGSALYTLPPVNDVVRLLWEYSTPQAALERHDEAVRALTAGGDFHV